LFGPRIFPVLPLGLLSIGLAISVASSAYANSNISPHQKSHTGPSYADIINPTVNLSINLGHLGLHHDFREHLTQPGPHLAAGLHFGLATAIGELPRALHKVLTSLHADKPALISAIDQVLADHQTNRCIILPKEMEEIKRELVNLGKYPLFEDHAVEKGGTVLPLLYMILDEGWHPEITGGQRLPVGDAHDLLLHSELDPRFQKIAGRRRNILRLLFREPPSYLRIDEDAAGHQRHLRMRALIDLHSSGARNGTSELFTRIQPSTEIEGRYVFHWQGARPWVAIQTLIDKTSQFVDRAWIDQLANNFFFGDTAPSLQHYEMVKDLPDLANFKEASDKNRDAYDAYMAAFTKAHMDGDQRSKLIERFREIYRTVVLEP